MWRSSWLADELILEKCILMMQNCFHLIRDEASVLETVEDSIDYS